jgi:hypothetical protein
MTDKHLKFRPANQNAGQTFTMMASKGKRRPISRRRDCTGLRAIKNLIVVSRTVVDQQQKTEKQLQLLIRAMNAFLKGFQKPNGNQ